MMNVSAWIAGVAVLMLLVGCARNTTEEIVVGPDAIIFDDSSGYVRVFWKNASGKKVQLGENHGGASMGWKVVQVSPDLIRFHTGDTGWYKVFREGASWMCLPDGIYLSPSKQKALRFTESHGRVEAKLGDTEAPFTDMWVHDQVLLQELSFEMLKVRWLAENRVEIVGTTGEVLATLQDDTHFAR